jgi:translocation and assembly module TamB
VVVRPRASRKPAAKANAPANAPATVQANDKPRAVALDVDVTLDPGTNFHLKGQGIDTRLEGKLTLRTEGKANGGPRLTGELRTVGGSYKAYGQTLDVDTGVLRFNGPYDNPALDILALRPNLQQPVGVQISGTAKLPVVRLYSEPDMADAEKLSWLVLGRASSTSGADYALLQSAALALMAGRGEGPTSGLIKAFGLDEVSLGETNTTNADGSAGTAATTVKVGKRLSRDFYVAYERSIATTLGTFYVFYDLSRRFTLRAESGTTNAIDLIFTTRFD